MSSHFTIYEKRRRNEKDKRTVIQILDASIYKLILITLATDNTTNCRLLALGLFIFLWGFWRAFLEGCWFARDVTAAMLVVKSKLETIKLYHYRLVTWLQTKNIQIKLGFWETAHLPLP